MVLVEQKSGKSEGADLHTVLVFMMDSPHGEYQFYTVTTNVGDTECSWYPTIHLSSCHGRGGFMF